MPDTSAVLRPLASGAEQVPEAPPETLFLEPVMALPPPVGVT